MVDLLFGVGNKHMTRSKLELLLGGGNFAGFQVVFEIAGFGGLVDEMRGSDDADGDLGNDDRRFGSNDKRKRLGRSISIRRKGQLGRDSGWWRVGKCGNRVGNFIILRPGWSAPVSIGVQGIRPTWTKTRSLGSTISELVYSTLFSSIGETAGVSLSCVLVVRRDYEVERLGGGDSRSKRDLDHQSWRS